MRLSREDLIFLFHALPSSVSEMPSRDVDPLRFHLENDDLQKRLDAIMTRISDALGTALDGKCAVCRKNGRTKPHDTGNGLLDLCSTCLRIASAP